MNKGRSRGVLRHDNQRGLAFVLPFCIPGHQFKARLHFFLCGLVKGQGKGLHGRPIFIRIQGQQVTLAKVHVHVLTLCRRPVHLTERGRHHAGHIPAFASGLQPGQRRNAAVKLVQHRRRGFGQHVIVRHNHAPQGIFHQRLAFFVQLAVLVGQAGNLRLLNNAVTL